MCEERLTGLGLFSLEFRRMRGGEKYCFLRAIQTRHTVHREGKERVQNVVLQS